MVEVTPGSALNNTSNTSNTSNSISSNSSSNHKSYSCSSSTTSFTIDAIISTKQGGSGHHKAPVAVSPSSSSSPSPVGQVAAPDIPHYRRVDYRAEAHSPDSPSSSPDPLRLRHGGDARYDAVSPPRGHHHLKFANGCSENDTGSSMDVLTGTGPRHHHHHLHHHHIPLSLSAVSSSTSSSSSSPAALLSSSAAASTLPPHHPHFPSSGLPSPHHPHHPAPHHPLLSGVSDSAAASFFSAAAAATKAPMYSSLPAALHGAPPPPPPVELSSAGLHTSAAAAGLFAQSPLYHTGMTQAAAAAEAASGLSTLHALASHKSATAAAALHHAGTALHGLTAGGVPLPGVHRQFPLYSRLSAWPYFHRYTGSEPSFLLPFRKPKRIRTAFSPSQLLRLEHAFEKNHYVVGQERKDLAINLSLTETQVKVWFQNRRTKHKRLTTEEEQAVKQRHGDKSSSSPDNSRDEDDLDD